MRAAVGTITRNLSAALSTAMLFAHPAVAQDAGSVSDYRLPDPKQTTAPRVQGPVDPENPYSTPSRTSQPNRSPTPAPSPTATPRVSLPPVPRQEPRPAPRASATAAPRATGSAAPAPAPTSPPIAPAAAPGAAAPAPAPAQIAPSPTSTDDAPLVLPPAKAQSSAHRTWLILGALALLAAVGGAVLLLRRRRSATLEEVEDAPAPAPAPAPEPAPVRPRPAAPAPEAKMAPAVATPAAPLPTEPFALTLGFKPHAIRLSLVYATLQYEIELANVGAAPLPPLVIRADLSSAHASIPTAQQLAPTPEALEIKHELATLPPGERVTLKGEVRVPIPQIRPLVKGNASFLVPLVRFCLIAPDGTLMRRVFTCGPRDPGSGAIASVRLDAGPRNLRELDAREIEAARGFALDPVAAHS